VEPPKGGFTSTEVAGLLATIPVLSNADLDRLMLAMALIDDSRVWNWEGDTKMKREGTLFDLAWEFDVPVAAIAKHHEDIAEIKKKSRGNERKDAIAKLPAPDAVLTIPKEYPLAIRTWAPKGQEPCEQLVGIVNDKPDAQGYCEVIYPSGQHVAAKPKELRPFLPEPTVKSLPAPKPAKSAKPKKQKKEKANVANS
jgi:hypothetical protein